MSEEFFSKITYNGDTYNVTTDFIINVTMDYSKMNIAQTFDHGRVYRGTSSIEGLVSVDKTFAEIAAAVEQRKNIVAVSNFPFTGARIPLVRYAPIRVSQNSVKDTAMFELNTVTTSGGEQYFYFFWISIDEDEKVQMELTIHRPFGAYSS